MAAPAQPVSTSASYLVQNSAQATTGSQTLQNLGEPYIRLRLSSEILAAVNTQHAQEVLVIAPEQLTVVPNMAPAVMGLINHRSRIFWVIDLPQIFGLAPLDPRAAEYHLAILNVNQIHIGIAVQQVQGITRIEEEAIAPPTESDLSETLFPYLSGRITTKAETLLVLDAAAIADYHP